MFQRPDILVLGGGGVLGELWMTGVLAGIEEAAALDVRRCEYFVGTSAGSILAARLAAGESPRRPGATAAAVELPSPPPATPSPTGTALEIAQRTGEWALALSSPLAPLSLRATAGGGALARSVLLRLLRRPSGSLGTLRRQVDATRVKFDGRLRVVTVARTSGRRVVFGSPSAPEATVGQAVEASCTVPWLFAPVLIAGVEYVDGGVWSPTNLDVAPASRGSQVLCLNPTAGLRGEHPLVSVIRSASRTTMSVEAAALRNRGAEVHLVAPDAVSAHSMGTNLMSSAPSERVLAAGYAQGLAIAEGQGVPTSSGDGAGSSRRRRALARART